MESDVGMIHCDLKQQLGFRVLQYNMCSVAAFDVETVECDLCSVVAKMIAL